MISSSELWLDIASELDQNAYTSWHNKNKILRVINSACNYLLAYHKWPWSLVLETKTLWAKWNIFTFDHNVFNPYKWWLDENEIDPTAVPIIARLDDNTWKFYTKENIINTSEQWLKLELLYHRWHKKLTTLGNDDIDIPEEYYQALIHIALWFVYPGGMDIWSSLANQNYNMAKDLLTTYSKAFGPLIQPKQAQPSRVY